MQNKARMGRYVIARRSDFQRGYEVLLVLAQETRVIAKFDSFVAAFDFAAECYWGTNEK